MVTKRKRRDGWIDWRGSKSKVLIVNDLREKKIPVDEKLMSATKAWETRYKFATEFVDEKVQFDQFKVRLKDHRKQNSVNANPGRKATKKATMKWRGSKSRALVLNDLLDRRIPIDEATMTTEQA